MNIASMLLRILAILGAVAAVVIFFIIGDTKQKLESDLEENRTRATQLQGQLTTAQNERQQVQEQATTLGAQVEELQANNSTLENQLVRVRQELAQATQIITAREQESAALKADADRIRRDLLAERNRIAQLEANLEEQDADALRSSIRELERQLLTTEQRLQTLQQTDPQHAEQLEQHEETRQALRGAVTEVGAQSSFVLINLGSNDGVRANSPVMIRRGARYIARANVTEVHEDVSVARVAPGAARIQPGDVVITLN
jgi:DNA repair exonuclease SbcCD ATPase subunit